MTLSKKLQAQVDELGIVVNDHGKTAEATLGGMFVEEKTAKKAVENLLKIRTTMIEYPYIWLDQVEGGYRALGPQDYEHEAEDLDEVIATALEECPHPEAPAEGEDPEEEHVPHSIVPTKYRNEYKARGDATRCSDWLCSVIDPYTMVKAVRTGKNGKTLKAKMVGSVEKTYALAVANGVTKQWPTLNNGQQCMNARNMIRAKVVKDGLLVIPASLTGGEENTIITADAEWLKAKRKDEATK